MVRIASFNVENLFARPKAFDTRDWAAGEPVLAAYSELNALIAQDAYTEQDRERMRELLVVLGIYYVNSHGAVRRRQSADPPWAWLRKNRGTFDTEPRDTTRDIEIIATGRGMWIGWVELAVEATDETGIRMTARVVHDVDADVLAVIEAEDRPALLRFDAELLGDHYRHLMLVDGNDERGIDVGLLTKPGFPIGAIHSHVDTEDAVGLVFSRDCAQYEVTTPSGTVIQVLVNHFKSQSGGGGERRRRQAEAVRAIVDELVAVGEHVVVLGDLNEGSPAVGQVPVSLAALFESDGPLVSCFDLDGFDVGPRPGTFDSCGIRNRLDYILLSRGLAARFTSGRVFRTGLWGTRVTRPTAWETYPEMLTGTHQASDHAALVVELDI
ncbi:Endonuclease/exonuclease/phosphatase [Beutenbergia cavernae DSM 12333]|uniref:Endonuclease/exonuclease/phosphatase n=1 Tax=Beutenbergia cavernae (strain ATCC BAA-8 / DSM 12333 / CCUG 43141 / JCM 11478 / NBRC 16432 / NCIMB 13614 / HKI 0122) TaxID=471853 RepID=C5C6G7_BEUC1|nr:endonuclease/exonuclease/phosphatase family protein [Beutenbergia cavernae]ACQ80373.1 Endonuclease/exonuclease/phosphatase [Beutenbergia cavernae DSM 12333]